MLVLLIKLVVLLTTLGSGEVTVSSEPTILPGLVSSTQFLELQVGEALLLGVLLLLVWLTVVVIKPGLGAN